MTPVVTPDVHQIPQVILVLALPMLVRIVMMAAVRVVAAVVVVVIALMIATAAVVHIGTFDATNVSVLSLHHVGPFAAVPTVVIVPGLPALQISTSIRLTSPIVPIVLLVVVILMESIPIRRLLLLLMRRVIVLMLVMVVVLMILRIAISHGIVACRCYRAGATAVHQMIRIAGNAIIQRISSIRGGRGTSRRNHNFLVISRVVPLQVRLLLLLLRGLLLWVQLLIEITIVKMWIAAE